ncbi:Sucrase/ferredoxin-like-domain-containing protein [Ephemerocybe angulata]|uniref:Sucrase/ferredoxin-like-domain-containing protein n=1 Tax=Ephemerocybe angulata TaxID=980116 RepID=A0A8H6HIT5_9AGAR|nr:Sucrase/ferredoxin-like-domain-containing protein [Tulosesus angulatus]
MLTTKPPLLSLRHLLLHPPLPLTSPKHIHSTPPPHLARPTRPKAKPDEKPETPEELQRSLHGSVQAHRCLVLLDSPAPISTFPARHSTQIQRELQLRLTKLGGIVNFAFYGNAPPTTTPISPSSPSSSSSSKGEEEAVSAVAYTPLGGRLTLPSITLPTLPSTLQTLEAHISGSSLLQPETQTNIDILVCTHGARDCRCGDTGGKVYAALREAVPKVQAEMEAEGKGGVRVPKIRVGEVAHVGGHKYAANVLIYPYGEWLGLITPSHVPELLSSIIKLHSKTPGGIKPLGRDDPLDIMPEHWRGRMGLGKEEMVEMMEEYRRASKIASH